MKSSALGRNTPSSQIYVMFYRFS